MNFWLLSPLSYSTQTEVAREVAGLITGMIIVSGRMFGQGFSGVNHLRTGVTVYCVLFYNLPLVFM